MKLEFNGKEFELPKWTMKLARMQDEVEKETTNEMLYKKSYEFVRAVIAKAELDEVLDGKSLEELDLVLLNNLYKTVCAKYIDALTETSLNLTRDKLDKMEGMMNTTTRLMETINASEKLGVK